MQADVFEAKTCPLNETDVCLPRIASNSYEPQQLILPLNDRNGQQVTILLLLKYQNSSLFQGK